MLPEAPERFTIYRLLVGAAALVVVAAGLSVAKPILAPVLFAALLAVMGTAPVYWLQRRRVPTVLAVLFVALAIVGILTGLGTLLAGAVNEFTAAIPRYRGPLNDLVATLEEQVQRYGVYLERYGVTFDLEDLTGALDPALLFDMMGRTLKGLVSAVSAVALAIICMVFILFEVAEFRVKLQAALNSSVDAGRLESVLFDVQRYLGIKTLTSLLTGLLVGGVAALIGLDFALLWGLIAFLLNYVPFVGSILAAVPAVLLALVSLGLGPSVSLALGYAAVNFGVSNFLEPTLMGRQLGLSPLVVFLALVFWGWIWGPVGMLLSVPLTMAVKILLEHSEDFRWLAVLMGSSRDLGAASPPAGAKAPVPARPDDHGETG